MWSALEDMEVAFIGPEEHIILLRKPSMEEFQRAASIGGVPPPRSWIQFYEITFDDYVAEKKPPS